MIVIIITITVMCEINMVVLIIYNQRIFNEYGFF